MISYVTYDNLSGTMHFCQCVYSCWKHFWKPSDEIVFIAVVEVFSILYELLKRHYLKTLSQGTLLSQRTSGGTCVTLLWRFTKSWKILIFSFFLQTPFLTFYEGERLQFTDIHYMQNPHWEFPLFQTTSHIACTSPLRQNSSPLIQCRLEISAHLQPTSFFTTTHVTCVTLQ